MKISDDAARKFTSEDIQALRAYVDELEALSKTTPPPDKVTDEEMDEAMPEIMRTGQIPEKYKGRIGEREITVHSDIVDGKVTYFPEGITKKAYYDLATAEYEAKFDEITHKYFSVIEKAVMTTADTLSDNGGSMNVDDIIDAIINSPVIMRELRKKAGITTLAPLGSVPNGESLNFLYRVIAQSKGGRMVEESSGNRHEVIAVHQKGSALRFTRENRQSGSTVIVEINQADKYLSKTNKTFTKVLMFTLQKMTAQHFQRKVGFHLQELVDIGMYSTTSNARRAVKDFFAQQLQTKLSGKVKKGKKEIPQEECGVLFYHYKLKDGYVTLSVNENFNMEFIATYFTVFPRFAYALSNNAFSLVRYIFFIARQNTAAIKSKGTFTINLEAIRENLGLPSVDEVKNRKYRQYIIEPIEKAIEEVEESLQSVPEAKEYGFTITPYIADTSNINQWLEGYLEIGLKGDFAETFVRIATNAEQECARWEKEKQAESARIAAREEHKAAKAAAKK